MIGEDRFTCSRRTRGGRAVPSNPRARNFHGMRTFSWQSKLQRRWKWVEVCCFGWSESRSRSSFWSGSSGACTAEARVNGFSEPAVLGRPALRFASTANECWWVCHWRHRHHQVGAR